MIAEAISSVLGQTYRPIEIIVVDDASTDETCEVVEEFIARHPSVIRLIRMISHGLGPGPVREQGRLVARGEYIQYLDSDDLLLPNKFEDQVQLLQANPDCGVAYGYTRLIDEDRNVLEQPFKWTAKDIDTLFPSLLVDRWWCTHTPLYRRSVCDAVGPWSSLRWGQDWEYDGRVGATGAHLLNTHSYVSEHRTHSGLRQTSPAEQHTFERLMVEYHLYSSLVKNANAVGIAAGTPEMIHVSRLQFMVARHLGSLSHPVEARMAWKLAMQAAGPRFITNWDLRAYGFAASVVGWRRIAILSRIRDLLFRGAGRRTMPFSWSKTA